jgi:hypothetical protein
LPSANCPFAHDLKPSAARPFSRVALKFCFSLENLVAICPYLLPVAVFSLNKEKRLTLILKVKKIRTQNERS